METNEAFSAREKNPADLAKLEGYNPKMAETSCAKVASLAFTLVDNISVEKVVINPGTKVVGLSPWPARPSPSAVSE